MATVNTTLRTAMQSILGGEDDITGTGQTWLVTRTGGNPAVGDSILLRLIDGEAVTETFIGGGDAVKVAPTFCRTFGSKVYFLAGQEVYFSAIDAPTSFNDPKGIGNGFVTLTNQDNAPEDMVAAVPFQGKLAFLSRRSTQIWNVPADPVGWSLAQTLGNVGTIANKSVASIGHLDVLFLSDSGVRSLRTRSDTLNAFVDDVGSPIDELVQEKLRLYPADAVEACAIVEPTANRYWLFLKDIFYVLSYFPSSKVSAWSTYAAIDSADVAFVPSKLFVHKGQVFARAEDRILQYGGASRNQYDNNHCVVELPWLDLRSPANIKRIMGLQALYTGNWSFKVSCDPNGLIDNEPFSWSGSLKTIGYGHVPITGIGTHVKIKITSAGNDTSAKLSSLIIQYQDQDEI